MIFLGVSVVQNELEGLSGLIANLQSLALETISGSTVFNGTTLFKHKGHDGHKGKTYESKALFSLCVLGALRGEALSR